LCNWYDNLLCRSWYFAPVGVQSIVINQSVCVSVCVSLSVHEHINGTPGPFFTKFCVQIPCDRGSVLIWRRCTGCVLLVLWMMSHLAVMGRMALRGRPEQLSWTSCQLHARQGWSLMSVNALYLFCKMKLMNAVVIFAIIQYFVVCMF